MIILKEFYDLLENLLYVEDNLKSLLAVVSEIDRYRCTEPSESREYPTELINVIKAVLSNSAEQQQRGISFLDRYLADNASSEKNDT